MGIGINDIEQKCLECNQLCCNRRSLGNHVAKSHKGLGGLHGYVMKHVLNGVIPKCLCGCGDDVAWHKLLYKFNDYVTGHNAKIEGHGYCVSGYRATPEQVIHRNASIKEAYEDKDLRNRIGNAVSLAFKDPVKHARLKDGLKKAWNNVERRREASQRAIILLEKGLIGPHAPFKTCWFENPFTGNEEFMHSSWETMFLEACIREQYPVTKVHGIQIPYIATDKTEHVYIPDFKSLDENVLFEIKGRRTETDDLKEIACRAWCVDNSYELIVIGTQLM